MSSIFKNRYGELRSGWSIAMALVLILGGNLLGAIFVPEGREDDIAVVMIVTLVYGIFTIGGCLLLFKLLYKRPLRQMGLIREGCFSGLLHGFVLGAISVALCFIILILTRQIQVSGINKSRLLSIGIIVELASVSVFAFVQELYCRGYIMTALKTTRNKWVILLSSSVIFSLAHIINPDVITVVSLANMALGGLLTAYMFVKSGKIWLPAGYHIAANFMSGDVFGMSSDWVHMSETSVFATILVGNNEFLLSGPDGDLLTTGFYLLGLLYVRFLIKTPSDTSQGPVWTMDSDLPFTR